MSMIFERKLPVPKEVKELYPLSADLEKIVSTRAKEIKDIFTGKSDKLVLVIGPCSADNEDSVIDYISRLRTVQDSVRDKIFIIPRIYTNKPRTTGDGYKGMLHQPDPNEKPNPFKGVLAIRALHTRILTELGMSTADEMLYPANYWYLSDLMSYVAVGARSVENQEHRLVSSGITVPVGMKNPTSGDLSVMMNAIKAAHHSHEFIYRGWDVETSGNLLTHAILRGSVNKHGQNIPNYHYEDLEFLCEMYEKTGVENPAFIVDTNHSNSGKKYYEQPRICKEVLHSCRHDQAVNKLFRGFIIESYLEDGCQAISADEVYGKSITDPCLGWDKTEKLIFDIADLL